ncbi:MAG: hypothetical protein R6X02_33845 [Enhygromyxa sp.]
MTKAPAAVLSVVLSSLACGPERVDAGSDDTVTSMTETSTETGAEPCPPEVNPLPLSCDLERQCPHLIIDQGSYNLQSAECILAALRDRRFGSYSYERDTGYTYAKVEFEILEYHAQWARDDWSDDLHCTWGAGISALRPPEHYADCLASGHGEAQADCFADLFSGLGLGGPSCPTP